MVRRLTPLWVGLIATGGLLLGIVLMYFFVVAGQRRIEEKINQLQVAAPATSQPAAVVTPGTSGRLRAPSSEGAWKPGRSTETKDARRTCAANPGSAVN